MTPAGVAAQPGTVDEAGHDRRIAEVATTISELVSTARREADRRRAAGEDTAWLEQVLAELAPLAEQTHDLELTHAIRRVVERHGPGPYPADDLAVLAGIDDVDGLRRVLEKMVTEGLARPEHTGEPPEPPS